MNADGSGARPVTIPGSALRPAWSPDRNFIAYDDGFDIHEKDLQAGADTFLTQELNATAPAWRPTDNVPPQISLAVATDGARYDEGSTGASDYSCTDPSPGSGVVASCVGPAPSGTRIDMSV